MRQPIITTVVTLTAMLALSGCGKQADTTSKTVTTTTTTTAQTPITAASASGLPADCDAYFSKVQACEAKMGASGAQFKQAMEMSRKQWANMPNKEMVGPMCKQALAAFSQQSSAMGCN